VSLTASKARYRTGFGPMLPGVVHAFFGDFQYLEEVLFKRLVSPGEVAAIVVEPILGEGGYVLPPDGWFGYLRELCSKHAILLVADEVQSGMGRTGKMWAVQNFGVEPDIVLAGKGIASGMPLGAMIAREDLMTWEIGAHGSTYGGNPLSCAAALASIELIEGGLMDNAAEVGAFLLDGLRRIQDRRPLIKDVRGLGLMIGIELVANRDSKVPFPRADQMTERVVGLARAIGLLLYSSTGHVDGTDGDLVMVGPPFVISDDECALAVERTEAAIASVSAR